MARFCMSSGMSTALTMGVLLAEAMVGGMSVGRTALDGVASSLLLEIGWGVNEGI